ncbi:MAG: DNA polymerase III subunit beta [Candidatus Pacebacteria bacterium]|nr:DNA polymerase III subunit beta [Candidatus Paceibacterota bacterium]
MKFISLQENLKKGIFAVSNITSKNISLPILNNILIKAEEGEINLIATNLEIGITYKLRGKIEKSGEIAVNSKIINDYVSLLPSDKVLLEKKDKELKVECKNYKTKIKTEDSDDFPLIPEINRSDYISVGVDDLKKSLSQVIFSVSNSDSRVEISGVLFSLQDEFLKMVSTDSYRLSEKKIKIENNIKNEDFKEFKIIVPAKTLQELLRILSNLNDDFSSEKDKIKIFISENQILFSFDSAEIVSRTISGQYPDYEQIIPDKFVSEAVINKQEFLRAIKACSIFSSGGINDIDLFLNKEKKELSVNSASGQVGESHSNLEANISGENSDIKLNFKYLIEGLNNIKDDEIVIRIADNNSPCLFSSKKDKNYVYIVMPIKQ